MKAVRLDFPGITAAQTRAIVQDMATSWGRCPAWRRLAQRYVPSGADVGVRIHRAVRDEIEYRREVGEVIQSPGVTLQRRFGDCDCKTLLVGALCEAHGIGWRPMLLGYSGDALVDVGVDDSLQGVRAFHIWPQLYIKRSPWLPGRWVDCETCHMPEVADLPPPAWGEHPRAYMDRVKKTL